MGNCCCCCLLLGNNLVSSNFIFASSKGLKQIIFTSAIFSRDMFFWGEFGLPGKTAKKKVLFPAKKDAINKQKGVIKETTKKS